MFIVALFTSDDSRDIPWAAPVKNDYNRRSEFYAEIQLLFAKVIRLYKDALSILESALLPFSHNWTVLSEEEKLNKIFQASNASKEFKQSFTTSRFGKKFLEYQPDFSFRELNGADAESTLAKVHGVSTTDVKDIGKAAAATKDLPEKAVEFLKALFPNLCKKAQLEEELKLEPNQELDL